MTRSGTYKMFVITMDCLEKKNHVRCLKIEQVIIHMDQILTVYTDCKPFIYNSDPSTSPTNIDRPPEKQPFR